MKKIKLDLDDLKVESFDTSPEGADGEVFGYCTVGQTDCAQCPTAYYTCPATCNESCGQPRTSCSCPIRSCLETVGATCPP
jgi:hypothetical protein